MELSNRTFASSIRWTVRYLISVMMGYAKEADILKSFLEGPSHLILKQKRCFRCPSMGLMSSGVSVSFSKTHLKDDEADTVFHVIFDTFQTGYKVSCWDLNSQRHSLCSSSVLTSRSRLVVIPFRISYVDLWQKIKKQPLQQSNCFRTSRNMSCQ